jgi:hypothetical protein
MGVKGHYKCYVTYLGFSRSVHILRIELDETLVFQSKVMQSDGDLSCLLGCSNGAPPTWLVADGWC